MKAVILAGGLGSRLSEETTLRPKPMIEVGGRPILWHIMKIYSSYGVNDFIICLGYKGDVIKNYFANYYLYSSDVTFDMRDNSVAYHSPASEPWRVTLLETGQGSMTGGRLRRALPYLKDEEAFCFTYGDGVSNVDIRALIEEHRVSGRLATLTAVQPAGKFGALQIEDSGAVSLFAEKPRGDGRWVNGGFFVLSPEVGKYLENDYTVWEREPLERIARDGQLNAYKHPGFWQSMDTVYDRNLLESYWNSGEAPWKVWG